MELEDAQSNLINKYLVGELPSFSSSSSSFSSSMVLLKEGTDVMLRCKMDSEGNVEWFHNFEKCVVGCGVVWCGVCGGMRCGVVWCGGMRWGVVCVVECGGVWCVWWDGVCGGFGEMLCQVRDVA